MTCQKEYWMRVYSVGKNFNIDEPFTFFYWIFVDFFFFLAKIEILKVQYNLGRA